MSKLIDITGQRFGRLTVIRKAGHAADRTTLWECKCDCGNTTIVRRGNIIYGRTLSCGCLGKERRAETNTKHNMSDMPLYYAWSTMRSRCANPKSHKYKMYGERGIKVCREWKNNFKAFYDHVSKLPHFGEEGRTLDRINDNGDYEPGNVRWATAKEQANNTRRNVFFEVNGERYSVRGYAEKFKIPYDRVYYNFVRKPREMACQKGEQ